MANATQSLQGGFMSLPTEMVGDIDMVCYEFYSETEYASWPEGATERAAAAAATESAAAAAAAVVAATVESAAAAAAATHIRPSLLRFERESSTVEPHSLQLDEISEILSDSPPSIGFIEPLSPMDPVWCQTLEWNELHPSHVEPSTTIHACVSDATSFTKHTSQSPVRRSNRTMESIDTRFWNSMYIY